MIDDAGNDVSSAGVGSDNRSGRPRRNKKRSASRRKSRDTGTRSDRRDPDGQNGFEPPDLPGEPVVLSRDEHIISRKNIDPDCLKVMRRLIRHGYKAFLVGGGVRDLLLKRQPKDFDLSTDAPPEKVRALFRNSRIIGRRFRLNHVYFKGNKIIEVSTFRSVGEAGDDAVQTLARDNTYGDPQTDAVRRDLTINGLFYDLETFSVIDYVGGIQDLEDGVIRIIGEPKVRFTEDPVRMIRAVRHAARTDFTIEPETLNAITELHDALQLCPRARVYEEFQRELLGGSALRSFHLLEDTQLLPHLFPDLARAIASDSKEVWGRLDPRLQLLDEWFSQGREISAAVAFATLMFDNVESDPVEGGSDLLSDYWRSAVTALQEDEGGEGETEAQSPKAFAFPKSRSRRKRTSPLMQSINDYFEPVGVPRRERERMEQILVARFHMVQSAPEGGFARTLLRASYFPDALRLLEVTSATDKAREAFEQWTQAAQKPKRSKQKKKRRRRRGRSRRKAPTTGNT